MTNVVEYPGLTTLPEPAEKFLRKTLENSAATFDDVLVIADTEDGSLWCGGNTSRVADILLLLKRAERQLLGGIDDGVVETRRGA